MVGSTEDGNNVRVFKLTRKKDGTGACSDVVDFPKVSYCTFCNTQLSFVRHAESTGTQSAEI